MQFCSQCKFLTYTKFNKDSKTLINYCKNCFNEEPLVSSDNSVYKRNYQEDYIADKIVTNKYTIYDVALPRVEFECINENCYTRQDVDKNLSFMIEGLFEDSSDKEILDLFPMNDKMSKEPIRIRLSTVLIQCKDIESKKSLQEKYGSKYTDYKITDNIYSPNKEVLYLKYDPINMKYLYMCVNCGTSWKKV